MMCAYKYQYLSEQWVQFEVCCKSDLNADADASHKGLSPVAFKWTVSPVVSEWR
jgi:hypothetical protein